VSSDDVCLRRIDPDDLAEAQAIFDDLSAYSLCVDGAAQTWSGHEFATAVPVGHGLQHKHPFIASQRGLPVGLLDIVKDYPAVGTAFIGLLAIREKAQGTGLGRCLYVKAEQFIRENLDARIIRLAVVETNPVIGFWEKMGFRPTGEIKPYQGQAVSSRSIQMEKVLSEL